jgi:hypothetical protein
MPGPTNNQILQEILESQKKQAVKLLQLAADLSSYTNKTEARFDEIMSFLESNDKTKQKGIIEQQSINTEAIASIKTDISIHKKIVYCFGAALAFLPNFIKHIWKQ